MSDPLAPVDDASTPLSPEEKEDLRRLTSTIFNHYLSSFAHNSMGRLPETCKAFLKSFLHCVEWGDNRKTNL